MTIKNPVRYLSIGICLIFVLFIITYTLNSSFYPRYNSVNNTKDRMAENKIQVSLKGGTDINFKEDIAYSDNWFETDSFLYNHNLAKSSLYVAISSFSSGDTSENWGEDIENVREENLEKVFKDLAFTNIEFSGYSSSLNNTESKSAFGVALRKHYVNNKPVNVICIAVRSGGYGCEWSDNFNVGDDTTIYHKGFYESATKIKKYVDDYIVRNCKNENVKFWICGYSRGGAVANILASIISDAKNVYAYTFATPNTLCVDEFNDNENHLNIFNIINPYDPVITLPPKEWGFGKIGYTLMFPKKEDADVDLLNKVSECYYSLTKENSDIFSYTSVSKLMNIITSFVKSRNQYNEKFQDVFQHLATATMTKVKVGDKWIKMDFERYLKENFGDKTKIAISDFENCEQYKSMESVGMKIPESIKQLDIVLRLYGCDCPEKLLFESMPLDSLSSISSLRDSKSFADFAIGHYPEVYVSWMKTINEKDFLII